MTKRGDCPKCGSGSVIRGVRFVDGHEQKLKAEVHRKPDAKVFKGSVKVSLTADVCGSCGFTEMYASDPARLLEAQKSSV